MTHYAKYETYPDGRWGYTIMHAIACRPNLFDCEFNKAVNRTGPVMLAEDGYYNVTLDEVDGAIVFLDKLDELPKTELEQLRELHQRYSVLAPYSQSATIFYNALETALGILEGYEPVFLVWSNRKGSSLQ